MNYSMNKKPSSNTINAYTTRIRSLLKYAFEMRFAPRDIRMRFSFIQNENLPRYFQKHQIQPLLDASLQRTNGIRCQTIITFLLGTGVRVSELVKLRVRDFNINEGLIYIRKSKGNKDRYIPIYPQVRKSILDYLDITGIRVWKDNLKGYLFSKDLGITRHKPISIKSIQRLIHNLVTEFDYDENLTVHSFRHTFAVHCLKKGMRTEYLSQILGHKDPKTTYIYTQLLPIDLKMRLWTNIHFHLKILCHK